MRERVEKRGGNSCRKMEGKCWIEGEAIRLEGEAEEGKEAVEVYNSRECVVISTDISLILLSKETMKKKLFQHLSFLQKKKKTKDN